MATRGNIDTSVAGSSADGSAGDSAHDGADARDRNPLAGISFGFFIPIYETFFVSLVMLSVVTSLLAGSWLERVAVRLGAPGPKPAQAEPEVAAELDAP
jgi:hypothetical protein